MQNRDKLAFSGSSLDRAAELRGEAATLVQSDAARACVFWRGKVLLDADHQLLRLPLSNPIFDATPPEAILLGRENNQLIFAADISGWVPEGFDPNAQIGFFDQSQHMHPACPDAQFADLRAVMMALSARDAELAATGKAVLEWHRSHRFCAKCGAKSEIAMGGWQRNCPACGMHHFPRNDPVVIMLVTHGNDVLIGRSPGWPEGMYSLLAGFIEPGETVGAAVRREVFEESGIRVGDVRLLASQPWPFPASLMLGCAGEAETREITIDPLEIEDALWVSREDMANVFAGQHPTINPARKGAIAHFLLENWLADRLVW
ncbi:MAG: NAD(+) diphosphatase [Yoonia sp.]|nr:NAD(+) diphosphatase [Yoonia sp.]